MPHLCTRTSNFMIPLLAGLLLLGCAPAPERIEVKVVVMAMFERGEARGDVPGELQFWLERLDMQTEYDFPLGLGNLYMNDAGVMAVLLGGGIPNATATTLALGLDDRFDFRHSYWLVAGIAGGDPADLSLGSAAWARHIVDGDLLYEIDGREIPQDWPYGMMPLGTRAPATDPSDLAGGWTVNTIAYSLHDGLVNWAYSLTRDIELDDAPGIAAYREHYTTYPAAQQPPFVTIGDTMSSSTYWHGELMTRWANDWVQLYRGRDANLMTSNMEDSGTLTALHRLANDGRIDVNRILVLRTASNFTMPPQGRSAEWSHTQPYPDNGRPALEAAFRVGNAVVQALLADWEQYRNTLPRADAP
ncbi:MAG: purine nucleoside permease [Gammaproteobacteria bacterium]|nr:purine nucleoside permease [Gammaproteobacteria bacterium]MDH5303811.1 purine nucleoside permease [Gammaproteobacteria bacterium]